MDILAVREATKFCAEYIRAGNVRLLNTLLFLSCVVLFCIGTTCDGVRHVSLLWPQYE